MIEYWWEYTETTTPRFYLDWGDEFENDRGIVDQFAARDLGWD